MKEYDIVIIGAGPAGLRCAEVLTNNNPDLKILLLERKQEIGPKICAGGLTKKDLDLMDIPDRLFEHKVQRAVIKSPKYTSVNEKEGLVVLYAIDRKEFGQWQADKLKNTNVDLITDAKVTSVEENKITVNFSDEYSYKYLVGADGVSSIVRRYLKLPVEKRLITFQYRIPWKDEVRFEMGLNSKYFHSWYVWIFPHKESLAVGCACNPEFMSPKKLKSNFHKWLKENSFDITNAKYESFPISYDYRGYKFNNVFLAGEAAGLACGFTGEGIYQALVSGEEVAKIILDENYVSEPIQKILKYNRIQHRILSFLIKAGPLRNFFFNMIVLLLKKKGSDSKISKGLS
jgi:geranylgeranyl reductase